MLLDTSFNRRITGWRTQSVAGRSEMQELLQQAEDVKQLTELLSRRSETSGNESGARGKKLNGLPAGADRANPLARWRGGVPTSRFFVLDNLPLLSASPTGPTLTPRTSRGRRASVGDPPSRRPHESSLLVGRRLRVDAVEQRPDQQTRLHLVERFQFGRVGVHAQLPH